MSLTIVSAGIAAVQRAQYPGWSSLGTIAQGWFNDPATKKIALTLALTALYAKAAASWQDVKKASKRLDDFGEGYFSSPKASYLTGDVTIATVKVLFLGFKVAGLVYSVAEGVAILSSDRQEAIEKVFVYGASLFSSQTTPIRVPWAAFNDLGFQVSPEEKAAVDEFLGKDAFFNTPPPPIRFWDDDPPIPGFYLEIKDQDGDPSF